MQGAVKVADAAFANQRRAMVDGQIRTFDVTDWAVIGAFLAVPRECFVPDSLRSLSYSDAVLTLPGRPPRAMLQPMHLARLLQGAAIRPADNALVVAGGSGYAAAVLAHLAASVVSLEADADLTAAATAAFAAAGAPHAQAVTGDLAAGYAAKAPYDVIVVPGAVEADLDSLVEQLAPDGRLMAIAANVGEASRRACKAIRFQKFGLDLSERFLFDATAPVIEAFRAVPKFVF